MGKRYVPVIYSAPWVLPIGCPPIRNGAVAVKDGRIEAVGHAANIRTAFSDGEEIECRGVLLPALINAHIHLELSHLPRISRPAAGQPMCDWISDLIRTRGNCGLTAQEMEQYRQQALLDQRRSGVILLADIGNERYPTTSGHPYLPLVLHFQEFLAPTKIATETARAIIAGFPDSVAATAHAPYSTSPELICLLKDRARRLGKVFSMHVAESKDEIEFVQSATGTFRTFLERLGAWDGTLSLENMALDGTVIYLQQLGVLDANTLCVHCVHITEHEVRLLAEKDVRICLCPGSNRFLRVGKAPVELMLRHGLLPAIGTDSIASNETLDIWREMRILREDHPDVEPAKILEMATIGGASALHCEGDFGSLAPGRRAIFLEVDGKKFSQIDSQEMLFDILTKEGRPEVVSWIDATGNVIPRIIEKEGR
jgi:aminodeoxyfutalosine deaminase